MIQFRMFPTNQISLRDIVNFNLTILPTKYPFGICNQRFDNFTTRNSFLKLSTKITYATHEISHRHIVFFNLTIYLPDSPALFGSQSRLEATNQISLQYIVNSPSIMSRLICLTCIVRNHPIFLWEI